MSLRISKVINRISWLGEIISELALAAVLMLIFYEVIARYVFNSPTLHTVELSEYLLVFLGFMGIGWVLKQDAHVSVTFVVNTLPEKVQIALKLVTSILAMVFCFILVWQGIKVAVTAFNGDYNSSSLLEFPMWIPYSAIPLGALVLMLQYIVKIGDIFKSLTNKKQA